MTPAPIRSTTLTAVKGIRHGFFTREGGVSTGIYSALNCGFGSKDLERDVAENRARIAAHLGTDAGHLNTVYQVHGAEVVDVRQSWQRRAAPKVDAMVSGSAGVALGILAADCTPVLFADTEAGVVGAAHAGWRGALAGVTDAVIAAMQDLGATRAHIQAAIGPCIAQESYEVGPEFYQAFIGVDSTHARFFRPSDRSGHHRFDLPGYVAFRLSAADIAGVERCDIDTYANADRCFSYRRSVHNGEGDYGRALSAIMLT